MAYSPNIQNEANGDITVAASVRSKALVLAASCGTLTIPAGSTGTALTVASIANDAPGFTATVGQSAITVNKPGWYAVTVTATGNGGGAGAHYHLDEGGAMSFVDGNPPEDFGIEDVGHYLILQSTGVLLFSSADKTIEMELSNSGGTDARFYVYIMAFYLREPAA